jgi:hypothetical protein
MRISLNVVDFVVTLALGLRPKPRLTKVRAKCEGWESHFMLPGVWESVREWTLTLPRELPLWELESWWTPEFSKSDCKGQNPLDRKVPYNIENFLECKCLKWDCMTHLDTSNISYGQKKGWESNCQIWFPIIKSRYSQFPCVKVTCDIPLERPRRGLQLFFEPHFDRMYAHKIMRPQSRKSLNFGNFGIPTWESWDKMTLRCWSRGHAHNIL